MSKLQSLVQQSKGKFFSVSFIKKDGSLRVANGKNRYNAHVHGGQFNGTAAGYVPVFDRNKKRWISVHADKVKEFKCGSVYHKF